MVGDFISRGHEFKSQQSDTKRLDFLHLYFVKLHSCLIRPKMNYKEAEYG